MTLCAGSVPGECRPACWSEYPSRHCVSADCLHTDPADRIEQRVQYQAELAQARLRGATSCAALRDDIIRAADDARPSVRSAQVFLFYPADWSFVCPSEIISFNEACATLQLCCACVVVEETCMCPLLGHCMQLVSVRHYAQSCQCLGHDTMSAPAGRSARLSVLCLQPQCASCGC